MSPPFKPAGPGFPPGFLKPPASLPSGMGVPRPTAAIAAATAAALEAADNADYEKLVADIGIAQKKVEKFEAGMGPQARPFRYIVNMSFPNITNAADSMVRMPLKIESFVTKTGTIFYAKRIECVYTIIGTSTATSQTLRLVVPNSIRPAIFRFLWSVRDTGSDRDWQSAPLPDAVLCTGNTNGFVLKRGHFLLSGGSVASVKVDASFVGTFPITNFPFSAIAEHQLQFSFVGFEVLQ